MHMNSHLRNYDTTVEFVNRENRPDKALEYIAPEDNGRISPCDFRFRRAKGLTLQYSFLALCKRVCNPILSQDLGRQLCNNAHKEK